VKSKYFFECGLFYFTHRGLWIDSDEINNESIIRVSRKINGGLNGYEERIRIVKKMYKILCSSTQ
jgi:predicted chitinase